MSMVSVLATMRRCSASARETCGLEDVVVSDHPELVLVLGDLEMGLEISDILGGHDFQLLGPQGAEIALGDVEEEVVPGLGRVQEAGRFAQDRGLVPGRGAPKVEDGLVEVGLAAPVIAVGGGEGEVSPGAVKPGMDAGSEFST